MNKTWEQEYEALETKVKLLEKDNKELRKIIGYWKGQFGTGKIKANPMNKISIG